MEIYQAGGGIHFTVEHTRRATEDQLYHLLRDRLMRMLYNGSSTHQYQIRAHILAVLFLALLFFPMGLSTTFSLNYS